MIQEFFTISFAISCARFSGAVCCLYFWFIFLAFGRGLFLSASGAAFCFFALCFLPFVSGLLLLLRPLFAASFGPFVFSAFSASFCSLCLRLLLSCPCLLLFCGLFSAFCLLLSAFFGLLLWPLVAASFGAFVFGFFLVFFAVVYCFFLGLFSAFSSFCLRLLFGPLLLFFGCFLPLFTVFSRPFFGLLFFQAFLAIVCCFFLRLLSSFFRLFPLSFFRLFRFLLFPRPFRPLFFFCFFFRLFLDFHLFRLFGFFCLLAMGVPLTLNVQTGRKLVDKTKDEILTELGRVFGADRIRAVQVCYDTVCVTFDRNDVFLKAKENTGIYLFGLWCNILGGGPP